MRHLFIFLLGISGLFMANNNQQTMKEKPDYIETGYYQLIYEADIAYQEGNDDLALEKIEAAKELCPLLNQYTYGEMRMYSALLLRKRRFAEAIEYIEKVITEYGDIPLDCFTDLEKDSILKADLLAEYPDFTEIRIPAFMNQYTNFYNDPERDKLTQEMSELISKDQDVRMFSIEDTPRTKEERAALIKNMEETDAQNLEQLYILLAQHGYPGISQLGSRNHQLHMMFRILFIHNSGEEKLQNLLLQYAREGKCSPYIYAEMIDHESFRSEQHRVYGVFENTTVDQIKDIDHLDERRLAIGLPTRELDQKRKKLVEKRISELN